MKTMTLPDPAAGCRAVDGRVSDDPAAALIGRQGHSLPSQRNQPTLPRQGENRQGRQPWLEQQVENTRRAARPRTCPRCDADVLVGPDHDTCALTVTVDATPVDPVTEVAALLAGRMSFDLVRGNLHHREPEHIHGRRNSHPILLTHVCDKETLW